MSNPPSIKTSVVSKTPIVSQDGPTTPVTEHGVRAFFEGLAALEKTLAYSAPGKVAVAITPSLQGLIKQFCGTDPRYGRVMANTWVKVEDYQQIKTACR